jgi:hypothetical protein
MRDRELDAARLILEWLDGIVSIIGLASVLVGWWRDRRKEGRGR